MILSFGSRENFEASKTYEFIRRWLAMLKDAVNSYGFEHDDPLAYDLKWFCLRYQRLFPLTYVIGAYTTCKRWMTSCMAQVRLFHRAFYSLSLPSANFRSVCKERSQLVSFWSHRFQRLRHPSGDRSFGAQVQIMYTCLGSTANALSP